MKPSLHPWLNTKRKRTWLTRLLNHLRAAIGPLLALMWISATVGLAAGVLWVWLLALN